MCLQSADIAVSPTTGDIHIGYYDRINGCLFYATRRSYALSWRATAVDCGPGVVGQAVAIRLDDAGRPHMVYYDASNSTIKYGRLVRLPGELVARWHLHVLPNQFGPIVFEGIGADRPGYTVQGHAIALELGPSDSCGGTAPVARLPAPHVLYRHFDGHHAVGVLRYVAIEAGGCAELDWQTMEVLPGRTDIGEQKHGTHRSLRRPMQCPCRPPN